LDKVLKPEHLPTKYLDDEKVGLLRGAFEHRSTWYYLLIDEMTKKGLSIEDARSAVFRCGCIHSIDKYPQADDLVEFAEVFMNDVVKKTLEADVTVSSDELKIEFHYCPHITAWQKLTDDKEKIAKLCDIAMEGDRAIVSQHPSWEFELTDKIGDGCKSCKMVIRKKS